MTKPETKAEKIRNYKCHIVVEMDGFMDGSIVTALQFNPAPVTVTMLGYPGTTGTKFVDYILGDKSVIPLDKADNMMTEKVAYMKTSCYVGSHKSIYPHMTFTSRFFDNDVILITCLK